MNRRVFGKMLAFTGFTPNYLFAASPEQRFELSPQLEVLPENMRALLRNILLQPQSIQIGLDPFRSKPS